MGKLGAITDGFAKGATAQQVEFATALRELHRIIIGSSPEPLTLKAIGKLLSTSEQHVSNILHAARQPAEQEVVALFHLAETAARKAAASDSPVAMPFSLDELQRLRRLAIKPCKRCRKWHDAAVAKEVENKLAEQRHADTGDGAGVPVPQRAGDRHPGREPSLPPWAAIEEVTRYAESGLEASLLTLLSHVGTDAKPNELPSIMHTLRSSGMDEAADAVADAAAARPVPVVLEIAFELHGSGLPDDLGRLLSSARAFGGS